LRGGSLESVAGTGVTVNSILAGPTESEGVGAFVEAMAKQENRSKAQVEKQFCENVRPSSWLKRFATVDEVAAMTSYLAGEVSSDERTSTPSRWLCREDDFPMRRGSRLALIEGVDAP
jgi:NAD(P)-dependent dehydrogenase (short-subunit alcohol dehydrogenase family)